MFKGSRKIHNSSDKDIPHRLQFFVHTGSWGYGAVSNSNKSQMLLRAQGSIDSYNKGGGVTAGNLFYGF
ncbi:hypothetical protein K420107F6_40360 [Lactonifactor longoviformis]